MKATSHLSPCHWCVQGKPDEKGGKNSERGADSQRERINST